MFTLLIDTFETGLGRLVFIARIGGFNEAQAILKFRSLFKQFDDPEAWDYYSVVLDVYDDAEKEQREKTQNTVAGLSPQAKGEAGDKTCPMHGKMVLVPEKDAPKSGMCSFHSASSSGGPTNNSYIRSESQP